MSFYVVFPIYLVVANAKEADVRKLARPRSGLHRKRRGSNGRQVDRRKCLGLCMEPCFPCGHRSCMVMDDEEALAALNYRIYCYYLDGGIEIYNSVYHYPQDLSFPGELKPQCLVNPHNGSTNNDELRRLMLEHPDNKAEDLIRNGGRLLGELAPTRAFGDVRYKWSADRLHKLAACLGQGSVPGGSWAGFETLPSPYSSPPYLIAKPDVSKFVVS